MGSLFKLPTKVLQRIGDFLQVSDKYSLLSSSKLAERAYYDDQVEQSELWDLIFKDKTWLDSKHRDGIRVGLIGDLKPVIDKKHIPWWNYDKPHIALVYFRGGKDPYHAIQSEGHLTLMQERRERLKKGEGRDFTNTPPALEKFRSDRKGLNEHTLKQLRSSLRSSNYIKPDHTVIFEDFTLHLACVISEDLEYIGRFLFPDRDQTLSLHYKGGPHSLSTIDVKFDRSLAEFYRSNKLVLRLIDHTNFDRDIKDCE